MGTRPNESKKWECRTIDSRGPNFRIDVCNPEMGANGSDVYKIYAVTDNKDVSLTSLSQGGTYSLHNDKSIEICAGMTNTDGDIDIQIASMKGDITITAMKNGKVRIKGANIQIQADEDIDIKAGRNISLNAASQLTLKGTKVQATGLHGNLIDATMGNFTARIFEPSGIGLDLLASGGPIPGTELASAFSSVSNTLGISLPIPSGIVQGFGSPITNIASNAIGKFF